MPIGTLAAQPPDECCQPHRGRCVPRPVGTRGGVGWMRGPCACPGGDETGWPHATQTNRHATRTSTRPPPCPTSAPCPYRTEADICHHSPIRSAPFIKTEADVCHHSPIRSAPFIRTQAGIFYHSPIRLSTFIRDGCGKWMVKQLPSPWTLSTATLPPIASIHSLTGARPNPVPARVGVFPAW